MSLDDLTKLGYDVGVAHGDVYLVSGFGVQLYVSENDTDTLAALADPESHKVREFQFDNPNLSATVAGLAERGIKVELDVENGKVLVTKPGDTTATAYTPKQVRSYLDGLPADRFAALRAQVQAATTAAEIKQALKAVLEQIAPPPA